MELNQDIIKKVVLPTAAYYLPQLQVSSAAPETCWQESILNPKNRIDSLDFPKAPSWRIDGCIAHGTQFYAIPLFLGPTQPHRVDVFIPNHSTLPLSSDVRDILDLSTAFHTRETKATRQLGITRHIVRCLQHWTATSEEVWRYSRFPFGSRIIFHNLPIDVREARITIAPTYHLERQMLSVRQLEILWQGEGIELPPTIDISELHYQSQPHDSVSVVQRDGQTLIFKAITSHTKYLYHELRTLLRVPPHPNIIARPLHLVTKKCGFGSKVAVLGFTLTYHPHGTVRDHLPDLARRGAITQRDEVRWAQQLVRALRHLRKTGRSFYSDLRLDNILLSDTYDLIMVDFEQRGVWSEFAAPEINAIECLRELATAEELPYPPRIRCAYLLTQLLPHWESLVEGEEYVWPAGKNGYNVAWQCLDEEEQESCEVYMLGRVLWCIFEAQSAPQRAAIWTSYKSEPVVEFPAYSRTPREMRRLIDWCTEGHVPTLSSVIVRSGNKLVLKEHEATGGSTLDDIYGTAHSFWTRRVTESERWVRDRIANRRMNHRNSAFPNRPSLVVVETFLEAYANKF